MNVLRINLFNEIVVGSDGSLYPGPEPLAVLLHGVPCEEPHYLLYLRDQVFGFVVEFALTLNAETPPAK